MQLVVCKNHLGVKFCVEVVTLLKTASKEPTSHQFRFDSPKSTDFDVLSSISGILLYVANDSAKSCANILEIVPDQPVALLPILPVITNQITASDDTDCAQMLDEYYNRLVKFPLHADYPRCLTVLLKSAPVTLQTKICCDLADQMAQVETLSARVVKTAYFCPLERFLEVGLLLLPNFGEIWLKIGEIWRNPSSQKMTC